MSQNQATPIFLALAAPALVSAFVFPTLSAYTATYVVLAIAALVGLSYWRHSFGLIGHPAYALVGLAYLLFALTLPFVWHGPEDLFIFVVLMPIPLAAGLTVLLEADSRLNSPLVVGLLCLFGSVGAIGIGINDLYGLGLERAGGGNNPVHFADLAVTLGYFSLVGLFGTRENWRYLFLFGPVFGFEAALMSGTRGAILCAVAMAVFVTVLLVVWFRRQRLFWYALATAFVLALVGLVASPGFSLRLVDGVSMSVSSLRMFGIGMANPAEIVPTPAAPSAPQQIDESTLERLVMYQAAWQAFLDAPLAGHGSGHIVSTAQAYYPERYKGMGNHLHSDIADFVVAGGVLGLAGYVLLLAAPFAVLRGVADTDRRRTLLLGAVTMAGSFFFNGLTNAVFGVLPQTVLYGAALACMVSFARDTGEV